MAVKIGKVTTLRKRPGSNVPCDAELDDDDAKFREQIIKQIDCTPMYWTRREGKHLPEESCKSDALRIADAFIQQYKTILKSYETPCIEMEISGIFERGEDNGIKDPQLTFLYEDSIYEEIENTKSFDLESFVSGVGGFIGIFLGYSILQIPELLGLLSTMIRNLKQDNRKGKF